MQHHNALDFGDWQDSGLMNAEAAKGTLETSHFDSFVLHMGSPERVGALPKGLVHLVAMSGLKPDPFPMLCLNCVVREGATDQDPRETFMAISISGRTSSSGCMAGVRVRTQGTGMARFQGRVVVASVLRAGSSWIDQPLGGPLDTQFLRPERGKAGV